jgi:hypothetical protein
MNTTSRAAVRLLVPAAFLALFALGCDDDTRPQPARASRQGAAATHTQQQPAPAAKPASAANADSKAADKLDQSPLPGAKKAEIAKNVYVEVKGKRRRVLVNAYVCLREGQLEQLMCRRHTKEHEAIIAADCDARDIHAALVVAGAKAGSVIKYFENKPPQPPSGTKIKVTLQFKKDGKTVVVPARQWIRDAKTGKDLGVDWVFAGSQFFPNQDNPKQPYYAANSGDVICVSNFADAMLDLPINSPKDNSELIFEANTKRIPPLDTQVLVILEPLPDAKGK